MTWARPEVANDALSADQRLVRATAPQWLQPREQLRGLVARGASTLRAFAEAQHDLVDAVRPIARRFVSPEGPV